jgi:acyl dehydratase
MLVKAALSALPRPRSRTLSGAALERRVKVDLGHLMEYQAVCGFRRGDALPPTYPHVLGFDQAMAIMTRADFPFPVIGLIHIANRIEQRRGLTAADELTVRVHAADLRDHPRGRRFDMITIVSADGEEVWREISTYLRREKAGSGAEKSESPQISTPHAIWRVGTSAGKDYARGSGDHNPIHTSRIGARMFGFPRPIAHGMWSKARCLAALEGRLPQSLTADVAFKAPILLPGKVAFGYAGDEVKLFHPRTGKPHLIGRIHA